MIQISEEDFKTVIKIANEAGKENKEVDITYIPPQSPSQRHGIFVTTYYFRSATGDRVGVYDIF